MEWGFPAGSRVRTDDVGSMNVLERWHGILVYEVVDANPSAVESAQIPVFVGVARTVEARTITPVAKFFSRRSRRRVRRCRTLPIPRFAATSPMTDCRSDPRCLEFLPKLEAYPQPTSFVAFSGAHFRSCTSPSTTSEAA